MATKPKNQKPKANKVPQTAAEKAARANLTMAKQMGVAQTAARASAASKGAYRPVQIRAGGDMSRYNLGRYSSDPFPTIPTTGPGGYSPSAAAAAGTRKPGPARSPKPKKPTGNPADDAAKQQPKMGDIRKGAAAEKERQRLAAEAAKKAVAKAKRDKAKAVSDGSTSNAPAKGSTSKAM